MATPLRLISAIRSKAVDLSQTQDLVLDEADKLFEDGFVDQIDEVLSALGKSRLHLFSATMPPVVRIYSLHFHLQTRTISSGISPQNPCSTLRPKPVNYPFIGTEHRNQTSGPNIGTKHWTLVLQLSCSDLLDCAGFTHSVCKASSATSLTSLYFLLLSPWFGGNRSLGNYFTLHVGASEERSKTRRER